MIIKQHIKKTHNSKTRNKSISKASSKSNIDEKIDGKIDEKIDGKIDGSLNNNLKIILNEADKITMNQLEFDTIFKEQSKILCDIKTLLNNEKKGTITKCNIIGKNDNKFNKLLDMYKKKYSRNTIYSTPTKKTKVHHKLKPKVHRKSKPSKSSKLSKPYNKTKVHRKTISSKSHRKSSKKQIHSRTTSTKKRTSRIKNIQNAAKDLNLTYPIVLLKNKKPYKNVIMIKNNKA
jgi:hypothetical protein